MDGMPGVTMLLDKDMRRTLAEYRTALAGRVDGKSPDLRWCLGQGFVLEEALCGSQYHLDRLIRGEGLPGEKDRALWDTKVIKTSIRKAKECDCDLDEFEPMVDEALKLIGEEKYQDASNKVRDMELKMEQKIWKP